MSPLGLKRGWTAFPNSLIDLHMPRLSDTEWRVLVVIVRQTIGWQHQRSGGRRLRCRISHQQLKKRTGRQSAAISAAIESLSTRGLIVVSSENGEPLATPGERRREKQVLAYAITPWTCDLSTETLRPNERRIPKSENNKTY